LNKSEETIVFDDELVRVCYHGLLVILASSRVGDV
jgi:hypothetical protein